METIVIYKSKTGFTKKYAEWIANELLADIFEASKVNINMLGKYDKIVYGGSLYASGILGVKLITKNIDKLRGKKIAVFATGVSPAKESAISDVRNSNFTSDQEKYIKFFYLRGGFDYSKLNFFDKFLMNLLKWKIEKKKKEDLTDDEIGMLTVFNKPTDFTRENYIEELVDYIRN